VRIVATHPDTIGDLVLRQPMYAALQDAGHELLLIARPLVAPLISRVAPEAELALLPRDLYDPDLSPDTPVLDEIVERARAFEPDTFVAVPFQWTVLEARLARDLEVERRIALSGAPFWNPDLGPPPQWTVPADVRVEIAEDTHELEKNRALAEAVLGKARKLGDPKLEPADEDLAGADGVLGELGLEEGEYWVACVGHAGWAEVRNWPIDRWAGLLKHWAEKHERRFLLIGHESEREAALAVRDRLDGLRDSVSEWFGKSHGELTTLLGLIARSGGYVGRDTGPMHVAAALDKPVLAVFGAGTWPRFVPAGKRSVAITVGAPMPGCGWNCGIDSAYVIRDVPLEPVIKAADSLEAGRIRKRTTRVLKPSQALLRQIARDGVTRLQGARAALAEARRQAHERDSSMKQSLEALQARIDRSAREASDAATARTRADQEQAARLTKEVERLRTELNDARARVASLEDQRVELTAAASRAEGRCEELERTVERQAAAVQQHAEARASRDEALARVEQLEQRVLELQAKNARLRDEVGLERERANTASARVETLKTDLEAARGEAEEAADGARALEQRAARAEQERDTRAATEQELRDRLAPLEGQLRNARSQINAAKSNGADLERQLQRARQERQSLTALSHQQARELVTVQRHVNELLASRWRKIGQAVGLAMTLDWERDIRNGRHSNGDS